MSTLGKTWKISADKLAKRSNYWQGKRLPPYVKQKLREARKGFVHKEETRLKISNSHKMRREMHHNWKGGITNESKTIRNTTEYKIWRDSVFKRDSYTCQHCGKIGGTLNADHIKPFSIFKDLRLKLENGRTLCLKCHKKTPTYAGRGLCKNKTINV